MSEDLVNLAQRWPERHATHYDGCEADHVGCLVKKLAREVERLTSERDEAQAEVEQLWRDLTAADGTIDGLRTELAQQDHDLQTAREDVLRLTSERDEARADVERVRTELAEQDNELEAARDDVLRLTSERDTARAEVRRLIAERDQPECRPRGREVGRFGLDGHYLNAMEPARPSDEDIWREAFITMLPSYPWEKAAKQSDGVLAEYRKRWPR